MKRLYLGELEGMTVTQIRLHLIEYYKATKEEVNTYHILVAVEESYGYEESSYFLLQHKTTKRFYEVHAGHCSCYGFEDQFKPERTTKKYLKSIHFSCYLVDCRKQVEKFMAELKV